MDDNSNTLHPVANTPSVPPANNPVPPAPQPVAPVSGGHKEFAPIGNTRSESVSHAPVESAPQIPKELSDIGIEASPDMDKPDIPPDVKQAGLQPIKTAAPVITEPQSQVTLPTPMNYQQAVTNLKAHKTDESVSWLSMLSKYVLEKIGMQNAA